MNEKRRRGRMGWLRREERGIGRGLGRKRNGILGRKRRGMKGKDGII